jgi:hypothetical protein
MDALFNKISKWFEKRETRDAFDIYLDYRKEHNLIKKELRKLEKNPRKYAQQIHDLKKEKDKAFKKMCKQEKELVDVSKGMFFGVGVDLKCVKELVPVYHEWKKLHNHYFVYGTSQVGKSRALASHARQFILANWNVVVVDPKGGQNQEILSWIIEFAGEALRTEDLFYYAPVYSDYTDCLNPLFSLGNEEIASMVQMLCKGNTATDSSDFFADFSYKVVLAILYALEFLETVVDPDGEIAQDRLNKETLNYYKMVELKGEKTAKFDALNKILKPDVATRMTMKLSKEKSGKKLEESEFAFLQNLISTMSIFPIPENITQAMRTKLVYLKNQAIALMRDLETMDKNFFEKVSPSLTTLLSQLATGKIGQLFCTVRINPLVNRLFREDKGVICVIQPAPLKFQRVSEMVVKIFLKMFESVLGVIGATGRGMARRLAVLIDEAKAVMQAGIEEIFNKGAQLGMTIGGYTQSRGDLQYKLGDKLAEVVEDCVNTTLTLRTNSSRARDYMAKGFGTQRVHAYNFMGEASITAGRMMITTTDEDIVKPHHLKDLDIGEAYYQYGNRAFRVQLPYQGDPHGALIMPQLKEEELIKEMAEKEQTVESIIFSEQAA